MNQIQSPSISPRLRLTVRGRVVISVAVVAVFVAVWAAIVTVFAPSADAYSSSGIDSSAVVFEVVVAVPGDTLWDIASRVAPASDPRDVIDDILRLNQFQTADLVAGQELAIPAKYSR